MIVWLPGFTVVAGEVLAVMAGWVTSLAVAVALPAVLHVKLNVCVPALRAAFPGKTALVSLEVIATMSFVLIGFQAPSTELTVTEKAVATVCAVGEPVLPLALPGAAVSPGISSCSLAKAPAVTVVAGEVFAVLVPSETSVAVTVQLPAVFKVTL